MAPASSSAAHQASNRDERSSSHLPDNKKPRAHSKRNDIPIFMPPISILVAAEKAPFSLSTGPVFATQILPENTCGRATTYFCMTDLTAGTSSPELKQVLSIATVNCSRYFCKREMFSSGCLERSTAFAHKAGIPSRPSKSVCLSSMRFTQYQLPSAHARTRTGTRPNRYHCQEILRTETIAEWNACSPIVIQSPTSNGCTENRKTADSKYSFVTSPNTNASATRLDENEIQRA